MNVASLKTRGKQGRRVADPGPVAARTERTWPLGGPDYRGDYSGDQVSEQSVSIWAELPFNY